MEDIQNANGWWSSLSKNDKRRVACGKCYCSNPEDWWGTLLKDEKIAIWRTCGGC